MKIHFVLISLLLLTSCNEASVSIIEEQYKNGSAVSLLKEGNERFVENHPLHPDQTLERMRALKKEQHPFAVVLSCSDSRVPPEIIFDQGLGDLFVIRNAGNIIGDFELGSIEYAVEHLHASVVIIVGHKNCGAIEAFIKHKNDSIPNHIQSIINYIKSEPEELALSDTLINYMDEAVKANVLNGIRVLQNSKPVLAELVERKQIQIIGAIYDLEDGKVNFLSE